MFSTLRNIWGTVWLLISTAPVWLPAGAVIAALHLAGLATASFILLRAPSDPDFSRAGISWSISLPTERLPFVPWTTAFSVGLLWDPRFWTVGVKDTFGDGISFAAAFGPLDVSFHITDAPTYLV